jgi:hypothetical protein
MRAGVRVLGIDDGPLQREHRGDVNVIGAVFRGADRLEGVLSTRVRRDGRNATDRLVEMISGSRFAAQLHYVMLDGIALGGFNVVDLPLLSGRIGLPVLVVTRNRPRPQAVREALLQHIPQGAARWRLIEKAGPVARVEGLHCQMVGLTEAEAGSLIRLTRHAGKLPEPIRVAHLIAAGITRGQSRGRA